MVDCVVSGYIAVLFVLDTNMLICNEFGLGCGLYVVEIMESCNVIMKVFGMFCKCIIKSCDRLMDYFVVTNFIVRN